MLLTGARCQHSVAVWRMTGFAMYVFMMTVVNNEQTLPESEYTQEQATLHLATPCWEMWRSALPSRCDSSLVSDDVVGAIAAQRFQMRLGLLDHHSHLTLQRNELPAFGRSLKSIFC